MKRTILYYSAAILLLFQLSTVLKAEDDLSNVESVLDRLEKRLLDQEADTLTFDERQKKREKTKVKAVTKYKFKGNTIQGLLPEEEKLRDLSTAITELEAEVDMLSSQLSRTKQSIIDDSVTRNSIQITAELTESNFAEVRSVFVSLDGYRVYELDDKTGSWMASSKFPIYHGPMQPGSHKLKVEVRASMKNREGIPLNNSVYKFADKTFDFHVPSGRFEKSWKLTVVTPSTLEEPLDVKMSEGKLVEKTMKVSVKDEVQSSKGSSSEVAKTTEATQTETTSMPSNSEDLMIEPEAGTPLDEAPEEVAAEASKAADQAIEENTNRKVIKLPPKIVTKTKVIKSQPKKKTDIKFKDISEEGN